MRQRPTASHRPVWGDPRGAPNTVCARTRQLPIGCRCSVIGAVVILCHAALLARAIEPDDHERRIGQIDRLIESLANGNEKPKIVKVSSGISIDSPLFPENYDWNEDKRVLHAFNALAAQDCDDVWRRLVKRIDDERYALNYADNNRAKQFSVGDLCRLIAEGDLLRTYEQFVELGQPGTTKRKIAGALAGPTELDDLKAWAHARKGKPLYELQIELCEWAVETMRDVEAASDTVKKEFIGKVQTQIVELRNNKKPVIRGTFMLGEQFEWYNAKRARKIREKYAAKQRTERRGTE